MLRYGHGNKKHFKRGFSTLDGKIKVKGRNVQVLFCPFHII